MEPNKGISEHDKKVEAKPVKEIVEPATTVPHKASVNTALKVLEAQNTGSSLVTNETGKLLGNLSKDQVNRKVSGYGHDPKTTPVEPQVEEPAARCFEDQTIGEAEKVMLEAKVDEAPVVTQEELLLGKATLGTIAQMKEGARDGEGDQ